ncbi:hypothetical protein [Klebsiella aerogenes]|nr:hypothetical protein [Klebsiella aerogenes]
MTQDINIDALLADSWLALLKLRNFTLPTQIFIVEASRAEPFADGDVEE